MSWAYQPILPAAQLLTQTPPTVALNSPADASSTSDTTPTLDFTGTDAQSNDVRYNVQIYQPLVSDDFNRANENPIAGNWTNDALGEGSDNQLKIVSNQLQAVTADTSCEAYWNADTFSGAIEEYFTVVTKPGNTQRVELGFIQQPGSATFDGYKLSCRDNAGTDDFLLERMDNSVGTTIATATIEFNAGDVIALSRSSTGVFTVWLNGVAIAVSSADTTYTGSFHALVTIRGTTGVIDNWGVRQIISDKVSGTDSGFADSPNYSYDFEESEGDRVDDFPSHADYTTTVSCSFWVKAESLPGSHQMIIVSKDKDGANEPNIRYLWTPAGGGDVYIASYAGGGLNEWKADYSPTLGVWEHWYFESDWTTNPDTHRFWVNGVEKTVTHNYGSNNITPQTTATQTITLGGSAVSDPNNYDGLLSDVAFWSDIVGETRADGLYNLGKGVRPHVAYPTNLTEDIPLRVDLSNSKGGSGTNNGATKVSGSPFTTDPFPSGANTQFTVESGDALASGTYYWRVRGIDPSGSNSYGAWSSTRSFTISTGGGPVSSGNDWPLFQIRGFRNWRFS